MVGQKIGKTDGWMSNIQSSLRPTSFWHFPKKVYLIPGWFQADMAWESWSHAEGPIWGFQVAALKGMKFWRRQGDFHLSVCLFVYPFVPLIRPPRPNIWPIWPQISPLRLQISPPKPQICPFSLKFSISSLSSALAGFLGSDPKGPMSCKT